MTAVQEKALSALVEYAEKLEQHVSEIQVLLRNVGIDYHTSRHGPPHWWEKCQRELCPDVHNALESAS